MLSCTNYICVLYYEFFIIHVYVSNCLRLYYCTRSLVENQASPREALQRRDFGGMVTRDYCMRDLFSFCSCRFENLPSFSLFVHTPYVLSLYLADCLISISSHKKDHFSFNGPNETHINNSPQCLNCKWMQGERKITLQPQGVDNGSPAGVFRDLKKIYIYICLFYCWT